MNALARHWGWIALRGAAALIFGVLTFINPAISLATLVLLFGAYALANGVLEIISAVANRGERHWVAMLVAGLLSVGAGLVTLFLPGITAIVLLYWIAIWAVATGLAEIMTAIQLRSVMTGEWMLILAGTLSVVFGVFLFLRPAIGALAVVLWIGAYAVVLGIMLIGFAFRLRGWKQRATMAGVR